MRLSRDGALDLSRILDEETPLPTLAGYYEILYEVGRLGEDETALRLFFPADQEDAEIRVLLLLASRGIEHSGVTSTIINKDEYLTAYKRHYTPQRPGDRIIIVPSWHKGSAEEQALTNEQTLPVYLDPGLAFGTGRHPTTTMMIRRLEQVQLTGLRITDAGCGSGILSLAALALGSGPVLAFDIDGNAVRATAQNEALNPNRGSLTIIQGGFELLEFSSTPCDLLLANLAENIIRNAAAEIKAGPQPRMFLSGIISEQVDLVLAAFDDWELLFRDDLEDWTLLDLARK